MIMAQDEILRSEGWPDDQVSAFFEPSQDLIFGAVTPKGPYLNISLLGLDLRLDAVSSFLERQNLSPGLNSVPMSLCGCTPRIAVSAARNYFGDRWVAVGDAAVTRLYKDGIGSALSTSRAAARTAIRHGISQWSFNRFYAPHCRRIAFDNLCGRILFRMWQYTLGHPRVLNAWIQAVRSEAKQPPEDQIHARILWGMFTGDEPYARLLRLTLGPRSLLSFLRAMG
jgi:flavin-dependent dehydrogenase